MKRVTLMLVIFAMAAPLASGLTLYVDGIGTDAGHYATTQDAQDAAWENDTIEFYEGTYSFCNLNLVGLNGITYQARKTGDYYDNVVITQDDMPNGGNEIYLRDAQRLTFDGLIFRGDGQDSGENDYGFYVRAGLSTADSLTFDHCIFTDIGKYALYGHSTATNLTIDHCSFIGNKYGVNMYGSWSLIGNQITNCLFYDNHSWTAEEWTTDGDYEAAHWSGYAVRASGDVGDAVVKYSAIHTCNGGGGMYTDGRNSLEKEATFDSTTLMNTHTPMFQSVTWNSQ